MFHRPFCTQSTVFQKYTFWHIANQIRKMVKALLHWQQNIATDWKYKNAFRSIWTLYWSGRLQTQNPRTSKCSVKVIFFVLLGPFKKYARRIKHHICLVYHLSCFVSVFILYFKGALFLFSVCTRANWQEQSISLSTSVWSIICADKQRRSFTITTFLWVISYFAKEQEK